MTLLNGICGAAGQLNYTPYAFTTAAGSAGIIGTNDGPGSFARFYFPYGVAADTKGNVFVADNLNRTVREMTPAGTNWTVTTIARGFGDPAGVAVDTNGVVYVADAGTGGVQKLTLTNGTWVLGPLASGFSAINCVAVDINGNVYVADAGNQVIRKVTPAGAITTLAGAFGSPGTNDGTGTGAHFNSPNGVAVDLAANVYVADTGNNTIRKVTPGGVVTTLAGLAGSPGGFDGTNSVARFDGPTGMAVDSATNIYVADSFNNTIRRLTPTGTNWVVTTIGGLLNLPGSADGTGLTARFDEPESVTVGTNGVVYVADFMNSTIREGVLVVNAPVIVSGSLGFSSNHFGFNLTGTPGQQVVVQASTNLVNWIPVWSNKLGSGAIPFSDTNGAFSQRFYRAFTP
jgi:hypothetical protein